MTTQRRRLVLAGALASVALALAGCSSGGGTTAGSGSTPTAAGSPSATGSTAAGSSQGTTAEATITIKDFAYGDPLTVAPGTTVTVINEDSAPHNANDAAGAFSEPVLQQGESATFVAPSEPGTYNLICTVHPQMSGELIVSG
ncbi:MAG: cupredoxin domain-containing protein [Geodermatophilaceae bacterium]